MLTDLMQAATVSILLSTLHPEEGRRLPEMDSVMMNHDR
jgi:hypothetical protein